MTWIASGSDPRRRALRRPFEAPEIAGDGLVCVTAGDLGGQPDRRRLLRGLLGGLRLLDDPELHQDPALDLVTVTPEDELQHAARLMRSTRTPAWAAL